MQPSYMGQDLLNPPSVEGWHTGKEWINSGSLMARINFVAEQIGNPSLPGVRAIINRLKAKGTLSPSSWSTAVSTCLGPMEVGADTKAGAASIRPKSGARSAGTLTANAQTADQRVGEMLQLIVATREYQFA